jgi:imidazolonepropionase-like amidohydrolase
MRFRVLRDIQDFVEARKLLSQNDIMAMGSGAVKGRCPLIYRGQTELHFAWKHAAAVLFVAVLLGLHGSARAQRIAIRNARIVPIQGAVIENGTLLIENGKIKALGANVSIPAGTTIIDGSGKTVIPGLVDANAHYGLRETGNEQSTEVTPQMHIMGLVNPRSSDFKRALQSGVTSACLTPGSLNVVGGLCAVVKTSGGELDRILVRDSVAERGALGQDTFEGNSGFLNAGSDLATLYLRRPNSRMGAVWEMRHALDQPKKYPALALVRSGSLTLRVHARIENDIRAALTIAQEFKISHLVIDDCAEGFRVADLLAERHVSVVLGPFTDPQGLGPERAETSLSTAGMLSGKGVSVAFGSNDGDPTQLLAWAAMAVRNGMSPEAALKAVTLNAAEIAGVADRVGSLAPGKDADILILSGDPLELTTHIECVLVNGQVVYRAE